MIVDTNALMQYVIAKQFKISHIPCDVKAFAKADIPTNIKSKINKQYSSDYLEDCDNVVFIKGPIDKDMVERIFKATDKSLGEDANKLVIGDFKLLKLNDADEDLNISDDSDETPDAEVDAIVNDDTLEPEDSDNKEVIDDVINNDIEEPTEEPEEDSDSEEEEPEEDSDSEEDTDKKKSKKSKKDLDESMNKMLEAALVEAGLSMDDILKNHKASIADQTLDGKFEKGYGRTDSSIKQIWIKELKIDNVNDMNSIAKLEITYNNGDVKESDFNIGTTGVQHAEQKDGGYKVSGEGYRQTDNLYKQCLAGIRRNQGKTHGIPKGEEINDEDVRVQLVKVAFNDWRIKWLFGKDKMTEPWYAFSRSEASPEALEIANKKAEADLKRVQRAEKIAAKANDYHNSRPTYQSGNTRIYRIEEDEEDTSTEDNKVEEKPALPTKFVFLKITMKK